MNQFKTSLMLGAAAIALPLAAGAQPAPRSAFDNFRLAPQQTVTGLYIGAGAGVNFLENSTLNSNNTLATGLAARGVAGRGQAIFEPGFVGVFSIGYGFGNGLRIEAEGNFRQNDIDKVGGFRGAGFTNTAGGMQRSYGAMANMLYDFRIPGVTWMVPYIGGGVGYVWRDMHGLSVSAPGGVSLRSSDIDGRFAYQAIGGAAFPIASVPGLAVTAEYRYLGTQPTDLNTRLVNTTNGRVIGGGTLRSSDNNHSVLVGLRYAFNQAPAPVPVAAVAAAPAPARTYLVFFDWDRADLTDRARQIIGDAATNARTVASTRIEVSGHADRTGTAAYNQRLSVRRAEAVAGELVRRGVARNEITIQGFGFDRPLVATAMGVREPQNRRVEIVLR
ncbi:OmpA family protein [Sediminicoccus sp. KRV36]|uniref:OmpA family protein n=1 Tax=Sediminicoccus sp. KRV36 TaxID=3133721 RepID=UPI00200FF5E1|nr:OmpA family protein [Sediminicoccus rosea]UPY38115.1 OmpA family protein [Sediminicoccus rosea]